MDMTDWTSAEYLGNIAAEELCAALELVGVGDVRCFANDNGDMSVSFPDIRDAETMISLGVPADARPGTLYDRATASCVTLSVMAAQDEPPEDTAIEAAIEAGWDWSVHPNMIGRRMDWHVAVVMPMTDATYITASLNALRRGAR